MDNYNKFIVWDLDNSLACEEHRSYLAENKQWEEFSEACIYDTPIQSTIELLKEQKKQGYQIFIYTGRDSGQEDVTRGQFKKWGIPCDELRMRRPEQKIPAAYLKAAWIKKYIVEDDSRDLEFVRAYDDDDKVINHFIKKGFETIDVKPMIKSSKLTNIKSNKNGSGLKH